MKPRFEQHSRTFAPSQAPPDDQISALAYSDGEFLEYSEDDVSLTTEPQNEAFGPPNKAFRPPNKAFGPPNKAFGPPNKACGPPHETNVSRGNSTKWSGQ